VLPVLRDCFRRPCTNSNHVLLPLLYCHSTSVTALCLSHLETQQCCHWQLCSIQAGWTAVKRTAYRATTLLRSNRLTTVTLQCRLRWYWWIVGNRTVLSGQWKVGLCAYTDRLPGPSQQNIANRVSLLWDQHTSRRFIANIVIQKNKWEMYQAEHKRGATYKT
jgi:hypothetical protein